MKKPFNPTDESYLKRITRRVEYTEFVDEFDTTRPDDTVIWGTYSRVWKNVRRRQVLKRYTAEVNGIADSITSHSRDYLVQCYRKRPAKMEQLQKLKSWRMPNYCKPGILRDGSYVDIRSAWFSVCMLAGWDCEYWPGRWLGVGDAPADFPLKENKVARSALVSVARSTATPVWKDGTVKYQFLYNPVENNHIYALIAGLLSSIAAVAVDVFGACYVASDGYILPTKNVPGLMAYIEEMGLQSRVKGQGLSIVCSVGSYWVGTTRSKRITMPVYRDGIRRDEDSYWLAKKIYKLNSRQ
jgi:hypothetical protein